MLCYKYNSTWINPLEPETLKGKPNPAFGKPVPQNLTTLQSQALNNTYIKLDEDYGPQYKQEKNKDGTINITFGGYYYGNEAYASEYGDEEDPTSTDGADPSASDDPSGDADPSADPSDSSDPPAGDDRRLAEKK